MDALIALTLLVTAGLLGAAYLWLLVARGVKPAFYQAHFGPAVVLACGRGYVSPAAGVIPVLDQFLAMQRDAFACASIPSSFAVAPLTGSQRTWRYLLTAAAIVWRVTGVSWSGLIPLAGMLFGATIAATYVLFRLVAGPVPALIGALLVFTSPLHWAHLPFLRDYAKAPFMVGGWFLLGLLLRAPLRPRTWLAVAAAFGGLVAIGSGFRNDLLVLIPAFLLVVLFFTPGGPIANLRVRAAGLVLATLSFYVGAWPLLGAYREGGGASMQHVVLLGLTDGFTESLGLRRPAYTFAKPYDDSVIGGVVSDYASRVQHRIAPITVYGAGYDAAANGLLVDQVRTFPADLVTRAYAAAWRVMNLPLSSYLDRTPLPYLEQHRAITRMYELRQRIILTLWWLVPAVEAGALAIAITMDLRLACAVVCLAVYFGGSAALQFGSRHFFHLNVIPVMALVFVLARLGRAFGGVASAPRWSAEVLVRSGARIAGAIALLVFVLVVPVGVLRAYQDRAVAATIDARLAARRVPVPVNISPQPAGRILLVPADALPAERAARAAPGTVRSEYLIIELSPAGCTAAQVAVTTQYDPPLESAGFIQTHSVVLGRAGRSDSSFLLTPVFFRESPQGGTSPPYRFLGLALDEPASGCVRGVFRVLDTGAFQTLFTAALTADWRARPLHDRIAAFEGRHDPVVWKTAPPTMSITHATLHPGALDVPAIAFLDPDVRTTGPSHWAMRAPGRSTFGYRILFVTQPVREGETAIVEGDVREGGLSIGVLRNDVWLVEADVMEPGAFTTVLRVPSAGSGSIAIAGNLTGPSWRQDFEIRRVGWMRTSATSGQERR